MEIIIILTRWWIKNDIKLYLPTEETFAIQFFRTIVPKASRNKLARIHPRRERRIDPRQGIVQYMNLNYGEPGAAAEYLLNPTVPYTIAACSAKRFLPRDKMPLLFR